MQTGFRGIFSEKTTPLAAAAPPAAAARFFGAALFVWMLVSGTQNIE
jgi:hypothetical protein